MTVAESQTSKTKPTYLATNAANNKKILKYLGDYNLGDGGQGGRKKKILKKSTEMLVWHLHCLHALYVPCLNSAFLGISAR